MRAPNPRPLARRYALLMCSVTLVLVLASGASEMYFGFREARRHIASLQASQAERAAAEINAYLHGIEQGLSDVARMPWGQTGFGMPQRREEFQRLMRQVPAITDLQWLDRDRREHLFVSKREDDRSESGLVSKESSLAATPAQPAFHYGRTLFEDGMSPSVHMAVGDGEGLVVATVDLRLLGDIVSRVRLGEQGHAYIVDAQDRLIAHAQPTEVLRQPDLSHFDAVQRARSAPGARTALIEIADTTDFQGQPVIASAARIEAPDWLLVVEEPRAQALGPALATLERTLLLIVLGGCMAVVSGLLFARRMAAPIVALRQATRRIAGGDLTSPIQVHGGDEIEGLAHDFNRMAAELRASYAGLEAKVAERTAQLSEARDTLQARALEVAVLNDRLHAQVDELAERRDEAERASAAKTRFLATASHDLRQPMHSISLLLSVLRDRLDNPSLVSLADKIQASAAIMEDLFGSLLDISKLDAGAVRVEIEDVDLGQLFGRLEEAWGLQALEQGLDLRVRPTRLVIRSDVALLGRIVGNLISNAIRYTRQGSVLLAARRRGDRCVLQVWDTGPGIEPGFRESIFEEFFRIDAPGAAKTRGLGLGLSIVRRGAQILGHGLRVHSRVGHGSMFELEMPLGVNRIAESGLGADDGLAIDEIEGAFVVIVDDDESNRLALANVLLNWRCHVIASASAEEALAKSKDHLRSPDLIITDFRLADGHDGFHVIRRLRAHHQERIPALMLTANTDGALAAQAKAASAMLLHKPVGGHRLLQAVLQAMRAAAAD